MNEKEKTEYGCRLWIDTDDDDPNLITELTGIIPTSVEIKGECNGFLDGKEISYKQNIWRLDPPKRSEDNEWNLCNSIEDVTYILDPHEEAFLKYTAKYANKGLMFYGDLYDVYWVQFLVQPDTLNKMAQYNMLIYFSLLVFNESTKLKKRKKLKRSFEGHSVIDKMDNNKRAVENGCMLWIDTDDDDPNLITQFTGIIPTSVEIKGEYKTLTNGKKKLNKHNLWNLYPKKRFADDELDFCNSIEDLTDILDQHEEAFIKHTAKYSNRGIMLYGDLNNDYWLQIKVQPYILKKMVKYNSMIDFSILVFNERAWMMKTMTKLKRRFKRLVYKFRR